VQQLGDLMTIELVTADDAFRVLYPLLNPGGEKRKSARLLTAIGLHYQLCDTQIEAHRGYLRLDDTFAKVLTLKEPPSETWPLILRDLLEIQANFTVVAEWKPLDNGKARKLIQSRRRHFHNSKTSFLSNLSMNDQNGPADELVDDSKQAAIRELGDWTSGDRTSSLKGLLFQGAGLIGILAAAGFSFRCTASITLPKRRC
jgi:hypothetical protein